MNTTTSSTTILRCSALRRLATAAALLACIAMPCGCLTLDDLLDPDDFLEMYGGTRRSYEQIEDPNYEWWDVLIRIVDMPLTIVADTVLLPLTAPVELSGG